MYNYDVFVNSLADLVEGKELVLSIRDLAPGIHQYSYRRVVAMVSANQDAYENKLQIRFGRGQEHTKAYSIKILEELPVVPEK